MHEDSRAQADGAEAGECAVGQRVAENIDALGIGGLGGDGLGSHIGQEAGGDDSAQADHADEDEH